MTIKIHNMNLPDNLDFILTSLISVLPHEEAESASLFWIFGGGGAIDFCQDIEQVIALYPNAITLVVPEYLRVVASSYLKQQTRILLLDNPDFFAVIQAVRVNCVKEIAGYSFLFYRKTLFVSPAMLSIYVEESDHDYEVRELQVESISGGVIHPLEISSDTGQRENREYGGVTTAGLHFVSLSATSRINGRYQSGAPAPEWYVGANPSLTPESIPYIDRDVVFLGPLHKHYGHFILESLARLWFFLEDVNREYLVAYISSPGEDRFNDVFELFGLKPEWMVKIDQPTQFRSVIVPEASIRLHDRYHILYKLTIDRIKALVEPAPYKKVFFAKKMRQNYRGMGEQPIVDIFRDNGYHIAYPETLSMLETVALLKGCEVFAASSGSNAHNAIFLEDGVEVICLNRSPHIHYPQTMIDRMKGLRAVYVDAYFSFLPADWSTGPFLFGPNKCLLEFFDARGFVYDYASFISTMTNYLYEYLRIWGMYYSNQNSRILIDSADFNITIAALAEGVCKMFEHLPVNIITRYD